jgi:hypothetical protein
MTPKEKADKLVNEMYTCYQGHIDKYTAKQCALIAVDEIIKENDLFDRTDGYVQKRIDYWQEVKQEIEKL